MVRFDPAPRESAHQQDTMLIKRFLPWSRRQSGKHSPDTSITNSIVDPAEAAGQLLRQQREQRALSLRDLSRQVRITTPVLEALERNWQDRLPEAAYLTAMLHRLEECLELEPGSLQGALPEQTLQSQDPRQTRLTRFTVGSIDIFTTWQGSVLYGLVILGSVFALNHQQRQLASSNTITLAPIPLDRPSESEALLKGLRPLTELRNSTPLEALPDLSSPQPRTGVLEIQLNQPSSIDLSSEGGDRTKLQGAIGSFTLQLLPPVQIKIQPAPQAGSVLWDGAALKSVKDKPGLYRLDQTSARNP
jgi:ribosome-binding protein aMBF1 (putative translation factor)